MSAKQDSKTIAGSYRMLTMPDKTQQLVEKIKLPNGEEKWVFVDDRLDDVHEFEARFAGTDTIPGNLSSPRTEALTPKPGQAQRTREHLEAHLIEVLGSPTTIITNKGLDPARRAALSKNTAERGTIIKIIDALDMDTWNKVRTYL